MPNYQNGKIYMIWCEDDKYYGSTTQTLSKRMVGHRTHYKSKNGYCSSFIIFEKYGIENCKIELVELFSCNSSDELRAKEGFYIRNNKCVNKIISDRTLVEWLEDNKEKRAEWFKKNYEKNKEQIKEQTKEFYQKNK